MKQLSDNNIYVFTTESCFSPIFAWECLGVNFLCKDRNEATFGSENVYIIHTFIGSYYIVILNTLIQISHIKLHRYIIICIFRYCI